MQLRAPVSVACKPSPGRTWPTISAACPRVPERPGILCRAASGGVAGECQPLLLCFKAPMRLHRRTRHVAVGAVDTAIARLRSQHSVALVALVEPLASGRRHGFGLDVPTYWTRQRRFENHRSHCFKTVEANPAFLVVWVMSAGFTFASSNVTVVWRLSSFVGDEAEEAERMCTTARATKGSGHPTGSGVPDSQAQTFSLVLIGRGAQFSGLSPWWCALFCLARHRAAPGGAIRGSTVQRARPPAQTFRRRRNTLPGPKTSLVP